MRHNHTQPPLEDHHSLSQLGAPSATLSPGDSTIAWPATEAGPSLKAARAAWEICATWGKPNEWLIELINLAEPWNELNEFIE